MDWRRAKKIVIILLVLLNAALGFLNYRKQQDIVLTAVQEKAIFEVLSKNKISLYTELLTKFPPMRKLSLKIPNYSRDNMKQLFFKNENTTVTVEFDKIIIKSDTKKLTMEGNTGTLEFLKGTKNIENLTQEQARRVAEEFMEQLNIRENHFEVSHLTDTGNGYAVTLFERYKRKMVFASNYTIYVTENGISKVDFTYFVPDGFVGEKKEICFSDEALLTFMKEVRKKEETAPITVTRMELGYDFQDTNGGEVQGGGESLVPCYQIYVMGETKPYKINAYTNELISDSK